MNALLISSSFFGYSKNIVKVMEESGFRVLSYEDRPSVTTFGKAVVRVMEDRAAVWADIYFERVIDLNRSLDVRLIIIIKGEAVSEKILIRFREVWPKARIVLYFWDSYLNMPPSSVKKVDLADVAFSFDPVDCAHDNRLIYRPLFFIPSALDEVKLGSDLVFVGTNHGDRIDVLNRIEKNLPTEITYRWYLYHYSKLYYVWARARKRKVWPRGAIPFFSPKSRGEVNSLMRSARAVVDIERPIQSGLTMRTMETLGVGRKLITTNPKIGIAEWYNSDNCLIIDRNFPIISSGFVFGAYKTVSDDIKERYSIQSWVGDLIRS